jgi:hypothetical protein
METPVDTVVPPGDILAGRSGEFRRRRPVGTFRRTAVDELYDPVLETSRDKESPRALPWSYSFGMLP